MASGTGGSSSSRSWRSTRRDTSWWGKEQFLTVYHIVLRHFSRTVLADEPAGGYYYDLSRGIDEPPGCADRIRKSIGAETTFPADLFTLDEARLALGPLIAKVWSHCDGSTIRARTVMLKAKYADFQQVTRSRTGAELLESQADL